MKTTTPWEVAPPRHAPRDAVDIAELFGEWAALARRPGADSERLALAIRVVEELQQDLRDAQRQPRVQ